MALIMLRYVPCIPTLVRVFIMNGFWTLSNAFFACTEICGYFHISFVNVVYDFDFAYVEPSLCTWDESHLVVGCDLFYMLLDSVG